LALRFLVSRWMAIALLTAVAICLNADVILESLSGFGCGEP
jgi:hypothetical protein